MIIFKNGCAQSRLIDHFCCCCCCFHRMIRIMRCGIVQMKTFACRFATGRPEIIQRIVTILRWTSVDRLAKNTKRERTMITRCRLTSASRTDRSIPTLDPVVVGSWTNWKLVSSSNLWRRLVPVFLSATDTDCEDTNPEEHYETSLWNSSSSLRRPRSFSAEEICVGHDTCPRHPKVCRAASPLRCSALVTITVATEDDCTAQIDSALGYDRAPGSFLDERPLLLSLWPHFHDCETVHMMAMTKENHLVEWERLAQASEFEREKLTEPLDIVTLLKYFAHASNLLGSEYTSDSIACAWRCIDVSETTSDRRGWYRIAFEH